MRCAGDVFGTAFSILLTWPFIHIGPLSRFDSAVLLTCSGGSHIQPWTFIEHPNLFDYYWLVVAGIQTGTFLLYPLS